MRYLIMKGTFPSMALLPARDTLAEASGEVARLEGHRAGRNARAAEYASRAPELKYRGGAFLHRRDEEPWSVKAVE